MSITFQVELSCHYVTGVPTNPIMLPMDNFTIKFIGELCPSNPVKFQWRIYHQNYRGVMPIKSSHFSMDPESEKIEKKIESFVTPR